MNSITQPLKWWGGKHYLAKKIIGLMPDHIHYVEPYAGGLAVLLEKDPTGISEVVNDLNSELTNFWQVLRDEGCFQRFVRLCQATPFSEAIWDRLDQIEEYENDEVMSAWSFFVRCRQSRAGSFKDFATLSRNRTRRGMNEQASAWLTCIEGLPSVHARLHRVVILNQEATEVIRSQDGPRVLHYLDPPYLHETRQSTCAYKYEMSEQDHSQLLDVILKCKGNVMLSGYPNDMYDQKLSGWRREDFTIDNKVAGGESKRQMTESVWMNF